MTEDEAKKVRTAAQAKHPDWVLDINSASEDVWLVQSDVRANAREMAGAVRERNKAVMGFATEVLGREVLGSEVSARRFTIPTPGLSR